MTTTWSGYLDLDALITEMPVGGLINTSVPYRLSVHQPLEYGNASRKIEFAHGARVTGIAAEQTTTYNLVDLLNSALTYIDLIVLAVKNRGAYELHLTPHGTAGFGVGAVVKTAGDIIIIPPGVTYGWYAPAGALLTNNSVENLNIVTLAGSSANAWDIAFGGNTGVAP